MLKMLIAFLMSIIILGVGSILMSEPVSANSQEQCKEYNKNLVAINRQHNATVNKANQQIRRLQAQINTLEGQIGITDRKIESLRNQQMQILAKLGLIGHTTSDYLRSVERQLQSAVDRRGNYTRTLAERRAALDRQNTIIMNSNVSAGRTSLACNGVWKTKTFDDGRVETNPRYSEYCGGRAQEDMFPYSKRLRQSGGVMATVDYVVIRCIF